MIYLSTKTCKDQHPLCKANCCKFYTVTAMFPMEPVRKNGSRKRYYKIPLAELSKDLLNYYNAHQQTLAYNKDGTGYLVTSITPNIQKQDDKYIHHFPARCSHLTKDLQCAVYGKPERPQVCTDGYTTRKEGLHIPEHCIYGETEDIKDQDIP